jgi:hypothetical protein
MSAIDARNDLPAGLATGEDLLRPGAGGRGDRAALGFVFTLAPGPDRSPCAA